MRSKKEAASLGHPLMFLGQARYRSIKRFKNLLRLSFLILITIIKRWIKRWMMQGISRYIRVTNIYCYLPSHQDGGHLSHDNSLRFLSFPSFKQSSRFLRDKDLKWIIRDENSNCIFRLVSRIFNFNFPSESWFEFLYEIDHDELDDRPCKEF